MKSTHRESGVAAGKTCESVVINCQAPLLSSLGAKCGSRYVIAGQLPAAGELSDRLAA